MTVWTKDPDEEADYSIDWSGDLGTDTIASSDWLDIEPGIGTTSRADTFTAKTTTIWIDGGQAGQVYSLTNRITTAGGRTFDQDVELRITGLAAPVPDFAGCDWPIDPACLTETWDTYSEQVRARAVHLASATLYRLCGYRVGGCPVTVRPSRESPCVSLSAESFGSGFQPINWNGHWANCSTVCADPRVIELPGPVGRIDEVKVNGNVVDPDNYALRNSNLLVWTGVGDPPWPGTQDWVLPDTEPGTFSITYLNAWPVDALGAYAAGLLAMEFAKACASNGAKCRLPANIVGIVRQGVSYEIAAGAFPGGKTGLREIDTYIEQWNPRNQTAQVLIDPGAPRMRVQR